MNCRLVFLPLFLSATSSSLRLWLCVLTSSLRFPSLSSLASAFFFFGVFILVFSSSLYCRVSASVLLFHLWSCVLSPSIFFPSLADAFFIHVLFEVFLYSTSSSNYCVLPPFSSFSFPLYISAWCRTPPYFVPFLCPLSIFSSLRFSGLVFLSIHCFLRLSTLLLLFSHLFSFALRRPFSFFHSLP